LESRWFRPHKTPERILEVKRGDFNLGEL